MLWLSFTRQTEHQTDEKHQQPSFRCGLLGDKPEMSPPALFPASLHARCRHSLGCTLIGIGARESGSRKAFTTIPGFQAHHEYSERLPQLYGTKLIWGMQVATDEDVRKCFSQVQGEVPGSPIFAMKLAPMSRHLEVQLICDRWKLPSSIAQLFQVSCRARYVGCLIRRGNRKICSSGSLLRRPRMQQMPVIVVTCLHSFVKRSACCRCQILICFGNCFSSRQAFC